MGSSEWAACTALQSTSMSPWLVTTASRSPVKWPEDKNFHGARGAGQRMYANLWPQRLRAQEQFIVSLGTRELAAVFGVGKVGAMHGKYHRVGPVSIYPGLILLFGKSGDHHPRIAFGSAYRDSGTPPSVLDGLSPLLSKKSACQQYKRTIPRTLALLARPTTLSCGLITTYWHLGPPIF